MTIILYKTIRQVISKRYLCYNTKKRIIHKYCSLFPKALNTRQIYTKN